MNDHRASRAAVMARVRDALPETRRGLPARVSEMSSRDNTYRDEDGYLIAPLICLEAPSPCIPRLFSVKVLQALGYPISHDKGDFRFINADMEGADDE